MAGPAPCLRVGGQALIEGVMMRSPRCFAVVVRRPDGGIRVLEKPWATVRGGGWAKIPFLRGMATLAESLMNGWGAMQYAADQQVPREGEGSAASTPTAAEDASSGVFARLVTVLVAVALFMGLPQALAGGTASALHVSWDAVDPRFHALAGFFKFAVFVGYVALIRRVPEIRRVFQYHGAEHKAIATYEAGEPLDVAHARTHSTRHARCGTTFFVVVIVVGILVNAVAVPFVLHALRIHPPSFGADPLGAALGFLLVLAIRLSLLPVVAGVAYEFQRLGARFEQHPLARPFLAPGFWVQGITTAEPDDEQLEIALASLEVALSRENSLPEGNAPSPVTAERSYPDFAALRATAG